MFKRFERAKSQTAERVGKIEIIQSKNKMVRYKMHTADIYNKADEILSNVKPIHFYEVKPELGNTKKFNEDQYDDAVNYFSNLQGSLKNFYFCADYSEIHRNFADIKETFFCLKLTKHFDNSEVIESNKHNIKCSIREQLCQMLDGKPALDIV